ncbi:hypothetical protein [Lysobacter gummosus]|uniref:hypothetical protein n=1 Tax=Lysobacter gummosus TaxID=262324 RepID=UPI00362B573B
MSIPSQHAPRSVPELPSPAFNASEPPCNKSCKTCATAALKSPTSPLPRCAAGIC